MRKEHILRKNHSQILPRQFIFVDTETYQERVSETEIVHKLRLGYAIYYRRINKWEEIEEKSISSHLLFYDAEDFWNWALNKIRKKSSVWIVAHNWNFDFLILDSIEQLRKRKFWCKKFVAESNCFFASFTNNIVALHFVDSTNYFKTSLSALGEVVGLEKLSVDFDNVSDDELATYCKRDVEILKEAFLSLVRFLKDTKSGAMQKTIASQAFSTYRHAYMKHRIHIHSNREAIELERAAYFGGRTECFYIGRYDAKVWYLDVNSMYPYVMKEFEYPTRLVALRRNVKVSELKRILDKYLVIAEVLVRTSKNCFPYRHKGKLVFPIGQYRTTLCTPELKLALEQNAIRKVYRIAVYEKAKIFEDYVATLYQYRKKFKQQGNKVYDNICKLLLNSLYGKFGQRGIRWEIVETTKDESIAAEEFVSIDAKTGEVYKCRKVGNVVLRKVKESESRHSFPAIAAHVTSYARVTLWEYIEQAGIENVLYVDTDSLFVNEIGYKRLVSSISDSELGKLKIEETGEGIEIRGLKDYSFNGKEKIKGIRKDAERISDNEFKQVQFCGIWKNLTNSLTRMVLTKIISKKLSREYTKGIASPISPRVLPLQFWEV